MRLVQVLVPEGNRSSVLDTLDEEGIDYAVFDEVGIEGVELVSVTVDYEPADLLFGNEPRVDVFVGIPRDLEAPPDLAQRWDDQLTEEFDRDLVVRVGFIEAQVSDGDLPSEPVESASRLRRTRSSTPIQPGIAVAGPGDPTRAM